MPCKQSASKEDFLKAIGLDVGKPDDKQKFQMLWQEVTGYWCSHFETDVRTILKPEYASNPAVHRPYKWAHISPQTIDRAIQEIWTNGSLWPRHFYDMGHSEDRRVYNWVLKWLLWHVCRYRDWRNRKGRNNAAAGKTVKLTGGDGTNDAGGSMANGGGGGAANSGGGEYTTAKTKPIRSSRRMTSGRR